ncbi:HNH endonuclease signature motif containing protein [Bacillus sp. OTU530]|uniref:HNH endonuclease signature motif containing protein n=1 Tax=Bacillus sp. OTU530 TaxID=3043862 RepID=UPI00313E3291
MEKYIFYNGLKFTRDDKTGYYLNSTHRKRLHRYVWECHHGEIPKGYHIHHIDHDKSNNDISNLKLVESKAHVTMHSAERGLTHYEYLVKNLEENARPKASEWHGSEEGHEWHKEQYKYLSDWQNKKVEHKCEQCGEGFLSHDRSRIKFCSNNCKSAWRRAQGLDNVKRKCAVCGNDFEVNKYSKTKTCSRKCAGELRKRS